MESRQGVRGLTAHYFFSFGCARRCGALLRSLPARCCAVLFRRPFCPPLTNTPKCRCRNKRTLPPKNKNAIRSVDVQLVGDRSNTRVEPRVLHVDVAAAALKLVQKGSVRVFLRFDAVNQLVFDAAEPRSVLVSCRDERRYFVDFQSAEDCLVFRCARCARVVCAGFCGEGVVV